MSLKTKQAFCFPKRKKSAFFTETRFFVLFVVGVHKEEVFNIFNNLFSN